jgi:NADH-quinone oxidoreductase subunit E
MGDLFTELKNRQSNWVRFGCQNKKGVKSMCCCNHESVDLSLIKDVLDKYADVKGSLISILQKTQEIYGYVPIDAVYHIAERTGLTPAKIMGVATFYSQFRFTAVGKYLIMVCKGTACYVNGAERIIDAISEELGIGNNETTADGLFSLSIVSCLGCCSLAPVMMINEDTYGSLTPDKVKTILRDIRAKEGK